MTATRAFDFVENIISEKRRSTAVRIVDATTHAEATLSNVALACHNASSNLLDYDIRRGEQVAIIKTDLFAECLACLCLEKIGAIPLIIERNLSAETYIEIINQNNIRYLLTSSDQQASQFRLIAPQMTPLTQIFTFAQSASFPSLCEMTKKENSDTHQILLLQQRTAIATTDDIALVFVTEQGKTKNLTHKQLINNLANDEQSESDTLFVDFLSHLHRKQSFHCEGIEQMLPDNKKKKERSALATFFLSAF